MLVSSFLCVSMTSATAFATVGALNKLPTTFEMLGGMLYMATRSSLKNTVILVQKFRLSIKVLIN